MNDSNIASSIFDNLQYWHWWVLAIVLVILEIISPAVFFLWMGISAGITGVLLLVLSNVSWEIQFLTFSIMSVLSIVVGKKFFNKERSDKEDPTIGSVHSDLIGQTFTLDEAIVNGTGRVAVGESTWKVRGNDCPEGSQIKVVNLDGSILNVVLVN